jgi:hypothetical protein
MWRRREEGGGSYEAGESYIVFYIVFWAVFMIES